MVTFGVESLDASSSPIEWVNRSESSPEIAEEDASSSLITLVNEGGMALIKSRVYGVGRWALREVTKIVVRDDLQDLI